MKVRAKIDVYWGGTFRPRGRVFLYAGPPDKHLEVVPDDTPLGDPDELAAQQRAALAALTTSLAGTPTPQVVFDIPQEDPLRPGSGRTVDGEDLFS